MVSPRPRAAWRGGRGGGRGRRAGEDGGGFSLRGQRTRHRASIDDAMPPVPRPTRPAPLAPTGPAPAGALARLVRDAHARDLPWRVRPAERAKGRSLGRPTDPYRVWLSEIMLQQTTRTARDALLPGVHGPAGRPWRRWQAAPEGDVNGRLGGARLLRPGPQPDRLRATRRGRARRRLPGHRGWPWRSCLGSGRTRPPRSPRSLSMRPPTWSTATSRRVGRAALSRSRRPLPSRQARACRALAGSLATDERPGDWAQALMDLGAMVCTPAAADLRHLPGRRRLPGADDRRGPRLIRAATAKAQRPGAPRRGLPAHPRRPRWPLVRRPARGLLGGMLAAGRPADWRGEPFNRRRSRRRRAHRRPIGARPARSATSSPTSP